jgi:SNF2 family DNA or RNA helicase
MGALNSMGEDFFSKNSLREGRKLLEAGSIKDLQFCEGIYQFTVKGLKPPKLFYPIIQLDDKGNLVDALCECPRASKEKSCEHLAASWLKIYEHENLPLHLRFRHSFWSALLKMVGEDHQFSFSHVKKKGKQEWTFTGFSMKALNAKGEAKLGKIINPPKMALENSLKFSSLTPEEHKLWQQGRSPPEIAYRLSSWSDLAEWLFVKQQEEEKYTVVFPDEETLPKEVVIRFKDVELAIRIEPKKWLELIPTLSSISSNLRVFASQYAPIAKATYDESQKTLKFVFEKIPLIAKGEKKTILSLEDWLFVPGLGFFPSHRDPILGKSQLENKEIPEFFDRHPDLAAKHLNVPIDRVPKPLKFTLKFIEKKGLSIEGYLFEPSDLKKKGCVQFDGWSYLPEKGFFKVASPIGKSHLMVPIEEISSFIAEHRLFLLEHEGFQIHLSTIEAVLIYRLDKEGNLRFELALEEGSEQEGVFDLGEWVYIHGRGFYPKVKQTGILRAGLIVSSSEIASFIERHTQELETISGFFALRCPIVASGLSILLNHEDKIVVKPSYQMMKEYDPARVFVFGSYTYVKSEGFAKIPDGLQLPAHFSSERTIPSSREVDFVMHQLEMLAPFILNIDNRLVKPQELILRMMKFKRSSSKVASWNLDLMYESSFGQISLYEIKEGFQKNKSYLFSEAGLIMLDLPRFTWIKELQFRAFKKGTFRITLDTLDCLKLAAFEEVYDANGKHLNAADWQALFEEGLKKRAPSLEGLKSVLRPYQAKGLEWLWTLYLQGLSGLLCDEMGLGKSHQAMALIAAMRNEVVGDGEKRFLIVCPTSVIFHWQELFKKFLPGAKVQVFHGTQRDEGQLKHHIDVIITSYGILRSERRLFKKLPCSLAVLDEIQVAKNPKSLTHRALKSVDSAMFLGLTGTPIENRLLDLKALFDIVLPKYLPKNFDALFASDSNWEEDPKRKMFLKELISPFILRRKKSEVLTELPEKTEEIYYCTLSSEQEKLYREAMKSEATALLKDLQDASKSVSIVHIFALLTKLKQICDHPCLVLGGVENYFSHASGKWDLFVELLSEARESGQKVVVFSQFLKMLDIIEAYLDERGVGHAGIRGATKDRQAEVHRFRDDPNCEVFVASLQAAGVGIDLVSASVVIHYDRWWNPAKENQATDRVHRIGQERGVQVFKLVSKNTVEEQIDKLIQKKTRLVKEAIAYDEQDILKQFDRSELIDLLKASSP